MDSIGDRIAYIVKESGLTKTAFAEKLNLSQSYVSSLCIGRKIPSDRTVLDICKAFDVSEEWIRTGKGDPYIQKTRNDEISDAINRMLPDENSEFRRRLASVLSALTEEYWILLEQKMEEIINARIASPGTSSADQARPEPPQPASDSDRLAEIMAMDVADMTDEEYAIYMKEYRRQAIDEKKAAENASASQGDSWTQKKA